MDRGQAPESTMEMSEDRTEILRRLDRLDERERLVISLRFGLQDGSPLTLKEIGRRIGVTREWVRKIELRAVSKLTAVTAPPASTKSPRSRQSRSQPRRPVPVAADAVGSGASTSTASTFASLASTREPAYPAHLPLARREFPAISAAS